MRSGCRRHVISHLIYVPICWEGWEEEEEVAIFSRNLGELLLIMQKEVFDKINTRCADFLLHQKTLIEIKSERRTLNAVKLHQLEKIDALKKKLKC